MHARRCVIGHQGCRSRGWKIKAGRSGDSPSITKDSEDPYVYDLNMRVPHLFYSTDVTHQTLHRRVTPTADQRSLQQERWNDLRDFLIGDLSSRTGLPISSWLQGSYKLGTQIRPSKGTEFDIDLGIYFGWPGDPRNGPYRPTELKSLIQQSLHAYAVEAGDDVLEVIEPSKERCARIRFAGNFHIDVPAYHLDAQADLRHLATETKGWESSDPKALVVWFRQQFDDEDFVQVRRLIRYLKIWATLNLAKPPPSILLTVLAVEAYRSLSAAQMESDDIAISNMVAVLIARLRDNPSVSNPAQVEENLNRLPETDYGHFISGLEDLQGLASAALSAASEVEAAYHWTVAFQHFFPAPREAANAAQPAQALARVGFDPQVRVRATTKNGAHTFENLNRIGPIPKACAINFTLENAGQLPPGARVQWIVRNEGDEAEQINDLGHLAASGTVATENSAYRGTHYMDVIVTTSSGRMLGYRRIPVQVRGLAMPPRNASRPSWTQFRGKR